jgi:hypothetical protein
MILPTECGREAHQGSRNSGCDYVPLIYDSQRQATKDAGRIAGLNVAYINDRRFGLAYGLEKKTNEKILAFDCGGERCVSVLEVGDGVFESNPPIVKPIWR